MDYAPTNARQHIDRIIYLASLVSEPTSVDATLDKLRIITVKSAEPSPEDIGTLKSIQAELEDYLVHKERLRSFTNESLRANVERHFATANPRRKAKMAALGQISTTFLGAGIATGIPVALGIMKGQVILAFLISALYVGLATIYQTIKKSLVAQLHGSLSYLMAAVVLQGVAALNFPIIAANSYLNNHPMLQHGGFLIGFIPAYIFYYLAFYLYAKQLNTSIPRALRPTGVLISAIILSIVIIVVPHPVAVSHEIFFDLAVIGFGISVYLSGVAAVLGFMAFPKTTAQYNKSTLFLAISMALQTIGNGFMVIFIVFMSGDFPVNEPKGQVLTGFLIMAALVFLYISAYKSKTSLAE